MPVDGPITGSETGLPDSWFVTRIRRAIRDLGKIQSDSYVGNSVDGVEAIGAMPFQSSRQPILDGSVLATNSVTGALTVDAVNNNPPAVNHCYMDLDTGELILNAPPPASQTISWKYRYVKWRDQDITDALQAGLRAMNAEIGKVDQDETLRPTPNRTDYDLPLACADPDARILKLEYRPIDAPIFPYVTYPTWELTGWTSIKILGARSLSPAGRFRLLYQRPYNSLGDLEPAIRELPIWYALSVLMPHQEGFRLREDRVSARISDQANQPGIITNTGEYYAKRFERELDRLKKRPRRGTGQRRMVSTYEMDSGGGRLG